MVRCSVAVLCGAFLDPDGSVGGYTAASGVAVPRPEQTTEPVRAAPAAGRHDEGGTRRRRASEP